MVHRRELDGRELIFGNQGALWGNAMTWWDHETGSVWSQPLSLAIAGPLQGERLELLPSTLTHWAEWMSTHPETLALEAPGSEPRFRLEDMAIAVEFGQDAVAYPVVALSEVGVINDVVAGLELAVVFLEDSWAVFSRRLDDGYVVDLSLKDGVLFDLGTETTFDPIRGFGLAGNLSDQTLDLLPAFTAFPRDFARLWPHGRIWSNL